MTRYPPERQRAITDLLVGLDGQRASVGLISDHLGVTTETVRRDLDVLERRGLLRRVRGGAELMTSTPFETALAARHHQQFEDKIVIARRVAEELPEDGVVILDSGSLTFVCAQVIPPDRNLTVVTNNLPAAQFLADNPNLQDHDAAGDGPRTHLGGRRQPHPAPARHPECRSGHRRASTG